MATGRSDAADVAREAPLHERLLAPRRPRLAEARAAVSGATDARSAWDALIARGVVPLSFADAPHREFHSGNRGRFAMPPTVDACVSVASDVDAIVRAEALAGELVARLRPWGAAAPAGVVWYLAPPGTLGMRIDSYSNAARDVAELVEALYAPPPPEDPASLVPWHRALVAAGVAPPDGDARLLEEARAARREVDDAMRTLRHTTMLSGMRAQWRAAVSWGLLCDAGLRVSTVRQVRQLLGASRWWRVNLPRSADGGPVRLADLPDPFAPLLALWETGYAVGSVTDRAVTLLGPLTTSR